MCSWENVLNDFKYKLFANPLPIKRLLKFIFMFFKS